MPDMIEREMFKVFNIVECRQTYYKYPDHYLHIWQNLKSIRIKTKYHNEQVCDNIIPQEENTPIIYFLIKILISRQNHREVLSENSKHKPFVSQIIIRLNII